VGIIRWWLIVGPLLDGLQSHIQRRQDALVLRGRANRECVSM
jgi:hypothetical protein